MPATAVPPGVRRSVALARFTTVRTGGGAEYFARVGAEENLHALLAWASGEDLDVNVVGSGSNMLIADDGVPGLVLKLEGDLAGTVFDGARVLCGGGARLPSVAAQTARAGLSGLEFGVNIPGTVGGAVKMNANAYGGELARVLESVDLVSATGTARLAPEQLGLSYRHSRLAPGQIVARASFRLTRAAPATVRATLAEMRVRRHEAQPSGIKTFGSTFKNPTDPRAEGESAGMLLSRAGCNGLAVGGARFAPKHANFVENTGAATTADVVALMAEGRRLVAQRFGVELEPEVQTLGPVRFPWRGSTD